MEKVHLESVQFTDYRILRYTNAKKGFERLVIFSQIGVGVAAECIQKASHSICGSICLHLNKGNICKEKT